MRNIVLDFLHTSMIRHIVKISFKNISLNTKEQSANVTRKKYDRTNCYKSKIKIEKRRGKVFHRRKKVLLSHRVVKFWYKISAPC